jgi:hypothetical protein
MRPPQPCTSSRALARTRSNKARSGSGGDVVAPNSRRKPRNFAMLFRRCRDGLFVGIGRKGFIDGALPVRQILIETRDEILHEQRTPALARQFDNQIVALIEEPEHHGRAQGIAELAQGGQHQQRPVVAGAEGNRRWNGFRAAAISRLGCRARIALGRRNRRSPGYRFCRPWPAKRRVGCGSRGGRRYRSDKRLPCGRPR